MFTYLIRQPTEGKSPCMYGVASLLKGSIPCLVPFIGLGNNQVTKTKWALTVPASQYKPFSEELSKSHTMVALQANIFYCGVVRADTLVFLPTKKNKPTEEEYLVHNEQWFHFPRLSLWNRSYAYCVWHPVPESSV